MENYSRNNLPLVSIVIPCRNEENFIGKCLDSILGQNYSQDHIEVLVVDGMSKDGTRKILRKYNNRFKNIKIVDNKRKITPVALNLGVKNSRGEIIIILGAHSFLKEDFILQNKKYLRKTNADCIGGVIKSIGKNYWGKVISFAMTSPFGVGDAKFRYAKKEGYVDTVAFGAYKKEVFKKIGLFDEKLSCGQDADFNFRIIKNGGKIFLSPKIKSFYYVRSSILKLWRQYFKYGFSKATMAKKHRTIVSVRSFVPLLFILTLIFSAILGFFIELFSFLFFIIIFSYLFLAIIFSFGISLKHRLKYFPALVASFFILHFSYGIGFFWGILR